MMGQGMSERRDYDQPATPDPASLTAEERRLQEARAGVSWRSWGPYLSERQWGTVREDYADTVLEDRRWPMARPYRRLTAAPIAGVSVAD